MTKSNTTLKNNKATVAKKHVSVKGFNKPRVYSTKGCVEQKIIRVMAEMQVVLGRENIPKKLVVILSDYSHENSKGFSNALMQLIADKIVERSSTEKGSLKFTQQGLDHVPSDIFPSITSNSQVQERLLGILLKKKAAPTDRVNKVWNLLLGGGAHSSQELLLASEYGHANSKGFVKILSALKELGLTEGKAGNTKMLQLTETAFPFGRPS